MDEVGRGVEGLSGADGSGCFGDGDGDGNGVGTLGLCAGVGADRRGEEHGDDLGSSSSAFCDMRSPVSSSFPSSSVGSTSILTSSVSILLDGGDGGHSEGAGVVCLGGELCTCFWLAASG